MWNPLWKDISSIDTGIRLNLQKYVPGKCLKIRNYNTTESNSYAVQKLDTTEAHYEPEKRLQMSQNADLCFMFKK